MAHHSIFKIFNKYKKQDLRKRYTVICSLPAACRGCSERELVVSLGFIRAASSWLRLLRPTQARPCRAWLKRRRVARNFW